MTSLQASSMQQEVSEDKKSEALAEMGQTKKEAIEIVKKSSTRSRSSSYAESEGQDGVGNTETTESEFGMSNSDDNMHLRLDSVIKLKQSEASADSDKKYESAMKAALLEFDEKKEDTFEDEDDVWPSCPNPKNKDSEQKKSGSQDAGSGLSGAASSLPDQPEKDEGTSGGMEEDASAVFQGDEATPQPNKDESSVVERVEEVGSECQEMLHSEIKPPVLEEKSEATEPVKIEATDKSSTEQQPTCEGENAAAEAVAKDASDADAEAVTKDAALDGAENSETKESKTADIATKDAALDGSKESESQEEKSTPSSAADNFGRKEEEAVKENPPNVTKELKTCAEPTVELGGENMEGLTLQSLDSSAEKILQEAKAAASQTDSSSQSIEVDKILQEAKASVEVKKEITDTGAKGYTPEEPKKEDETAKPVGEVNEKSASLSTTVQSDEDAIVEASAEPKSVQAYRGFSCGELCGSIGDIEIDKVSACWMEKVSCFSNEDALESEKTEKELEKQSTASSSLLADKPATVAPKVEEQAQDDKDYESAPKDGMGTPDAVADAKDEAVENEPSGDKAASSDSITCTGETTHNTHGGAAAVDKAQASASDAKDTKDKEQANSGPTPVENETPVPEEFEQSVTEGQQQEDTTAQDKVTLQKEAKSEVGSGQVQTTEENVAKNATPMGLGDGDRKDQVQEENVVGGLDCAEAVAGGDGAAEESTLTDQTQVEVKDKRGLSVISPAEEEAIVEAVGVVEETATKDEPTLEVKDKRGLSVLTKDDDDEIRKDIGEIGECVDSFDVQQGFSCSNVPVFSCSEVITSIGGVGKKKNPKDIPWPLSPSKDPVVLAREAAEKEETERINGSAEGSSTAALVNQETKPPSEKTEGKSTTKVNNQTELDEAVDANPPSEKIEDKSTAKVNKTKQDAVDATEATATKQEAVVDETVPTAQPLSKAIHDDTTSSEPKTVTQPASEATKEAPKSPLAGKPGVVVEEEDKFAKQAESMAYNCDAAGCANSCAIL